MPVTRSTDSLFQRVRNWKSELSQWRANIISQRLVPWSKTIEDQTEPVISDLAYFWSRQGKIALEVLYRNNWALNKAVKVRANLLSGRGLKIITKTDEAKRAVKELLLNMHPTRPLLALQNMFRKRSITTDIFGNSFDELLYTPKGTLESPAGIENATGMVGIHAVHPIKLDLARINDKISIDKKTGMPTGWDLSPSDYGGLQKNTLPLDRIAHLTYETIGDELLGIPSIGCVFKTGDRFCMVEEAIAQGIKVHGNPLKDVTVGDETHPPSKSMIDETADEIKGLNFKSEYVHPPWIRVNQIESFSLGKSPNYLEPFILGISTGMGVPEFILTGRGMGTNKATAQEMIKFIHQTIEPLQQSQAMYFEEQILAPYMTIKKIDEIPLIEYNEIIPADPQTAANIVKTISEVIIGGKQIIDVEQAKEMLRMEAQFGMKTTSEMASKNLPGIIIVEPHASRIIDGSKRAIVKSKLMVNAIDKPLYLLADNKVFGIIKLKSPKLINLQQFTNIRKIHTMTEDEREKSWPDVNQLYLYELNVLKAFKNPKKFNIPQGAETFVKEVMIDGDNAASER